MATYYSDQYTENTVAGGSGGYVDLESVMPAKIGETITRIATVTLSVAVAAADVLKLLKMPANCLPVGWQLYSTDLDTNGTPTITIDLGDENDDDVFAANDTVGQAGGTITDVDGVANALATYAANSADVDIQAKVEAGPATGAASGTVRLQFQYVRVR